jgi:hypothetical protein
MRKAPGKSPSKRAAESRAAEAAPQVELYGDAIEDVTLLRRRDYVVVREGERRRVGTKLLTNRGIAGDGGPREALAGTAPGRLGARVFRSRRCAEMRAIAEVGARQGALLARLIPIMSSTIAIDRRRDLTRRCIASRRKRLLAWLAERLQPVAAFPDWFGSQESVPDWRQLGRAQLPSQGCSGGCLTADIG